MNEENAVYQVLSEYYNEKIKMQILMENKINPKNHFNGCFKLT